MPLPHLHLSLASLCRAESDPGAIPRTLMSLGSVVLFQDKIASNLCEKELDQMGAVPVVINNQDASHLFDRTARHTKIRERRRS